MMEENWDVYKLTPTLLVLAPPETRTANPGFILPIDT